MENEKIANNTEMRKINRIQRELWQFDRSITSEVFYRQQTYVYPSEFAVLVPSWCPETKHFLSIRNLRERNKQGIAFVLNDGFMKEAVPFNMYYSLASYEGGFPFVRRGIYRDEDKEKLKELLPRLIISYDWLIDIDADSHEHLSVAKMVTKNIMAHLDRFRITYEVRFSGMGFHIVVPYSEIKGLGKSLISTEENNIYEFLTAVNKRFYDLYGEMVDFSISDFRRLCKLPYSSVGYRDGVYIAFPFSSLEQFDKFVLSDAVPYNSIKILKDAKVFNSERKTDMTGFIESLGDLHGKTKKNT